jgi:hypothetical protein
MRPRGQQDHRHVRPLVAQVGEQLLALQARGGVLAEVHVLDDQVHRLLAQQRQSGRRRFGVQGVDVVQGEQHFQRRADGAVVVDDEDGRHAL